MQGNIIKLLLGVLLIATLIIGSIIILSNNNQEKEEKEEAEKEEVNEIVFIGVNPAIALHFDENEEVIKVTFLSEDALVLYEETDFIGEDLSLAVGSIINDAIDTGFIDEFDEENVIYLTVTIEEKEDQISNIMTQVLEDRIVFGEVVVENISTWRENLFNILEKEDQEQKIEDLLASIEELRENFKNNLLEHYGVEEISKIRQQLRNEMQVIRTAVADSIKDYRLMTREERRETIREKQTEIRNVIDEKILELEIEKGFAFQWFRQVNGEEIEELQARRNKILTKTEELFEERLNETEEELTEEGIKSLKEEIRREVIKEIEMLRPSLPSEIKERIRNRE